MAPRRAYLCHHKLCVPPVRVFLQPGEPEPPQCPDGHGRMTLQANMPYSKPLEGSQTPRRAPTRPKRKDRS